MNIRNKSRDNEVYILGSGNKPPKTGRRSKLKWAILLIAIIFVLVAVLLLFVLHKEQPADYYFEPETDTQQTLPIGTTDTIRNFIEKGYTEVLSQSVNDVPLLVYIPHNATLSLALGVPDASDSTLVFATMAADIRRDNKQIVGDFVLSGERLSRGEAKKGFCAIEGHTITIGVGDAGSLLQQVIDNKGSFFRQYPLVYKGKLVENKLKNKSIRRALAILNEQTVIVESRSRESFHDFSQALIDLGVTNAIYLVGGDVYGWYYTKENAQHVWGQEPGEMLENISYVIWRTKE